jgi:hypothetical protein
VSSWHGRVGRNAVVYRERLKPEQENIVRRQRPPDPLQLELADRLDLHGVLDFR